MDAGDPPGFSGNSVISAVFFALIEPKRPRGWKLEAGGFTARPRAMAQAALTRPEGKKSTPQFAFS